MRGDFWDLLKLGTAAQLPLLGISLAFLAAQLVLGFLYPAMDLPPVSGIGMVLASTLVTLAIVTVTLLFVSMAVNERPKHPAVQLLRHVRDFLTDAPAMAAGLPVFAALVVFIFAFSNVKGNIPMLQPFAWDMTLDQVDAALHFGRRPWEWLQPVLGHWPITFVVSVLYNLWFIVMFSVWLHYAFMAAPGVARTRFFLAFMLLWMIGGGAAATIFSSAGPCFYGAGRLGISPDPYAGLVAYLHAANEVLPIWAVDVQSELWKLHVKGSAEASISAMPSMHNGSALLFALASRGWPRWLRRALWLYVVVIFVGSIHLAYHYAVDSYVAWALTLLVWQVSGVLARRWEETAVAERFRSALARKSGFTLTPEWSGLEHLRKNRRVPGCPPTRPTSTRTPPITSR